MEEKRTLMVTDQETPSDPTGTNSTGGVMAGLAAAYTPQITGELLVIISGNMSNDTANAGVSALGKHGTGSAPANGAAVEGTTFGDTRIGDILNAAGKVPFFIQAVISGLTIGTAYWFDLVEAAITGGTATLTDIVVTIVELPKAN